MPFDSSSFSLQKSLNLKSKDSGGTMDMFGGIVVNDSMAGSDILAFGDGVMNSIASAEFYTESFEDPPSLVATDKTVYYWGDE